MSDLELLAVVLALIYGWECACWLRRGSVGFLTAFGRNWRVAHPASLIGNQQGGFIFTNPLPPLGMVLTANQLPLSLSPDGILAFVSPSVNPGSRPVQSGKIFRFEEIRSILVNGRKLKVNGELLLKAGSPTFAQYLANQLNHLRGLPPAQRAKAIEQIFVECFNTKEAESRWQEFLKVSRPIRVLTNLLFLYLFAFAPLIIWHFGVMQSWGGLLIGLGALTLPTSILFRRAHTKFYPKAGDERFTHFLTILLSPATAIRAHDVLSRPRLEEFHPLVIAKLFCRSEQFRAFARELLREVRHPALPVAPTPQGLPSQIERSSRALLQKTMETFLQQNGLEPDELSQPPTPSDDTCRSFCPRCLSQFTSEQGLCADCGGLPTMPFSPVKQALNSPLCEKP
jgi:hypothetical protein